jgi:NAD(P)-dependent dehydrogenase (short-subunit alcohol dehydrogenase family)
MSGSLGKTTANTSLGAVESLQQEVAPFNVKTLLVEPGYFRTEFLNKDNAKYTNTTLEDYRPLCEAVFSSSRATEGNQTGDPAEGVNRVIDIVKGEGYAAGKEFPPWVLLGPDVLAVARKKMEDNLKLLNEWAELSLSTDLA